MQFRANYKLVYSFLVPINGLFKTFLIEFVSSTSSKVIGELGEKELQRAAKS